MNLKVYSDFRVEWKSGTMPCALGRSGISSNKKEGDGTTPIGVFPIREVFYRADRIAKPATTLPCHSLTGSDGWCDDAADPLYNRAVKLPYKASHEEMMRHDGLYDLVVVIGYNDDPVIAGLGSAIFLHVAAPGFAPTEGCVALAREDLVALVEELRPGDNIEIMPEKSV